MQYVSDIASPHPEPTDKSRNYLPLHYLLWYNTTIVSTIFFDFLFVLLVLEHLCSQFYTPPLLLYLASLIFGQQSGTDLFLQSLIKKPNSHSLNPPAIILSLSFFANPLHSTLKPLSNRSMQGLTQTPSLEECSNTRCLAGEPSNCLLYKPLSPSLFNNHIQCDLPGFFLLGTDLSSKFCGIASVTD